MKNKIFSRIFISFIGLILTLWSITNITLQFAGESATAVITNIRRQGGERKEVIPNRYTYSIGYTFTTPDGLKVYGTTTKVGSPIYIKSSGTSTMPIQYFKWVPFISVPKESINLSIGQLIIIGLGFFLIIAVNKKSRR